MVVWSQHPLKSGGCTQALPPSLICLVLLRKFVTLLEPVSWYMEQEALSMPVDLFAPRSVILDQVVP